MELTLGADEKYKDIDFRKVRTGNSMTHGRKPGFKK